MTDATAIELVIADEKSVAHSLILSLVPAAWQELIDKDAIGAEVIPVAYHHSVISAKINGEIVGFLNYTRHPLHGNTWIEMAYVIPSRRKLGIYKALFEHLVAKERANTSDPVRVISSGIGLKNTEMVAAASKMGRTSNFAFYDYTL